MSPGSRPHQWSSTRRRWSGPGLVRRPSGTLAIGALLLLRCLEPAALEESGSTLGMAGRFQKELESSDGVQSSDENRAAVRAEVECPENRTRLFEHMSFGSSLDANNRAWSRKGPFPWAPPEGKFLVMECHMGQASNRLECIQNHILIAGLLNRTLVIGTHALEPSAWHYNWTILVDIPHIRDCFGACSVLTTEEYASAHGGELLPINALLCYSAGGRCNANWQWWAQRVVVPKAVRNLLPRNVSGFVAHFTRTYESVPAFMVGDLVYRAGSIPGGYNSFDDVPFIRSPHCKNNATILPHSAIVAYGKEFVAWAFGGRPFVSVHYRGRDLWRKCLTVPEACVSVPRAAQCIADEVVAARVQDVLVCSDRPSSELRRLEGVLKQSIPGINLIMNPRLPDSLKDLRGLSDEGTAAFHKIVMAHGVIFLGTRASTFSLDVIRMRFGFKTKHCRDGYLCQTTLS